MYNPRVRLHKRHYGVFQESLKENFHVFLLNRETKCLQLFFLLYSDLKFLITQFNEKKLKIVSVSLYS